MLLLKGRRKGWHHGYWSALLIVLAIGSLMISVATRYTSPEPAPSLARKTLHKHTSPETSRQRLTKVDGTSLPMLARRFALEAPVSYAPFVPAGSTVPALFFSASL